MKYLLLAVILVGCSSKNEDGVTIKEVNKVCIEGHIYFYNYGGQYGGYMSPKFDYDGKLIECSMKAQESK